MVFLGRSVIHLNVHIKCSNKNAMGLNEHSLTFHRNQESMFKLNLTTHNMHNPCKFITINNIQSNLIDTYF